MERLAGKTAAVTGAGSGIGRAMALAFAAEGMNVVVIDIEAGAAEATAAEARAKGVKAAGFACDVTNREALKALAARVEAEFGGCHLLCNNAGVVPASPVQDCKAADYDWSIAVNLQGVLNGTHAFLPGMLARGEGHIVNTASIGGLYPGVAPNLTAYAVAKYGVVGLSENMRIELAPLGVGISVLCPGTVRTNIASSARNRQAAFGGAVEAAQPIGRSGAAAVNMTVRQPDEVAAMVVRGVKQNAAYVMTSAESRNPIRDRFEAILAAFDEVDAHDRDTAPVLG